MHNALARILTINNSLEYNTVEKTVHGPTNRRIALYQNENPNQQIQKNSTAARFSNDRKIYPILA